jgi:hypothetical protein
MNKEIFARKKKEQGNGYSHTQRRSRETYGDKAKES